jgi:glyoxylase I family protein
MGFEVTSRDELVQWQTHFESHGVTHTPVVDRDYGSVLTFKDPDRIQFEMFYLNPALATD